MPRLLQRLKKILTNINPAAKPIPWWRWLILGLLSALILIGLVYVGYVRPIQLAAAGYWQRINSNGLDYSGNLEFYGQDFLSALDSKISFGGSYQRQPLAANLNFNGNWATKPLSGLGVLADGRLYVNLAGPQLPVIRFKQSSFLLPMKPQWYGARFDESLFDNVCQNSTPPNPTAELALYRQLKTLRLQNSWWVNLWDGRGRHFQGRLPGSQLSALLTAVQNALPAGCGLNTVGLTAADANHIQTTYDLWANPKGDRLQLGFQDKALGSRMLFTLVTSGYGQPVAVRPPAQSVDLNAIYALVKPSYYQNAP